ncbi:MAG: FecR domain-containing protein [Verrucomicrobiota bacterium JB022]|nr:FecR domain-containing protein [Verrucomicrobiota bacterium JB022]
MQEEFAALVAKSLAGETTREEREELEAWLRYPEYREQYQWLQKQWQAAESATPARSYDAEAALVKLRQRIQAAPTAAVEPEAPAAEPKVVHFPWQRLLQVAAVLALCVCGYGLYSALQPSREQAPANELVMVDQGQRVLTLTDGTRVRLNAGSTLRFPAEFASDIRRVELSGEGFFEVSADPEHPFIVATEAMEVRVTGTVFNVRNYPDEGAAQVSLLEGKVDVSTAAASRPLQPAQQFQLDKQSGGQAVQAFDQDEVTAWTEGRFVFRNEPLEQVARELGRHYGVTFEIGDEKLAHRRVTGDFSQDSLGVIVETLAYSTNATYEMQRDGHKLVTVRLKPGA